MAAGKQTVSRKRKMHPSFKKTDLLIPVSWGCQIRLSNLKEHGPCISIARAQAVRHERRMIRIHRKVVEDEFESEVGDEAFDLFGRRWLHAGQWGKDHPVNDWVHPAWRQRGGIFEFYERM
ncbi:uncharacterized protein LOC125502045 isoform X2 [Athalia rosae]|uniref:uncharacterized protein LOC125502045 isoform X2 n=1 Tax=Athalia rosae TaxID=37344 RepID=UPI002033388A|nr:uncharacterized protein LOC125502045 isoform X2 [Athalia rosae]